ncbi:unnamed protein product, partial [Lampetra planeri]
HTLTDDSSRAHPGLFHHRTNHSPRTDDQRTLLRRLRSLTALAPTVCSRLYGGSLSLSLPPPSHIPIDS